MALITRGFLTGAEMAADPTQQVIENTLGNFDAGMKLRRNMDIIQAERDTAEAKKQTAKELDIITRNKWGMRAPEETTPEVVEPVPAPAAPEVTQPLMAQPASLVASAPAAAPTVGGIVATMEQPAVSRTPVPVNMPMPGTMAPGAAALAPTDMATTEPAPAPAQPSVMEELSKMPSFTAPTIGAVVPTPATASAFPATVADLRAAPTINGQPNPVSLANTDRDYAMLDGLVKNGQISPQTAELYMQGIEDSRNKSAERVLKTRKEIAEIAGSELGNAEKRVAIAAKQRDYVRNQYNDVYDRYTTGGKAAAQAQALELGLDINFDDPKAIEKLQYEAKRSSDYAATQTAEKAADKEARAAAKGETAGLPDGFERRAVKQPDNTYKSQIFAAGSDTPATLAEITRAKQAQSATGAKAAMGGGGGRAGGGVGGGSTAGGSEPVAGGEGPEGQGITIFKNTKQGPVVDKPLFDEVKAQISGGELATGLLPVIDEAIKASPNASSSRLGGAIAGLSTVTEATKTQAAKANETLQRAASQIIAAVANFDPRAKGAPSNADVQGMKEVIFNPASSPEEKTAALTYIQGKIKRMSEDGQYIKDNLNPASRQQLGIRDQPKPPTDNTMVKMVTPRGTMVDVPTNEVDQARKAGLKPVSK